MYGHIWAQCSPGCSLIVGGVKISSCAQMSSGVMFHSQPPRTQPQSPGWRVVRGLPHLERGGKDRGPSVLKGHRAWVPWGLTSIHGSYYPILQVSKQKSEEAADLSKVHREEAGLDLASRAGVTHRHTPTYTDMLTHTQMIRHNTHILTVTQMRTQVHTCAHSLPHSCTHIP